MKAPFLLLLLSSFFIKMHAQDIYMSRTGEISFFSKTALEDIEAKNNAVTCIFKKAEGKIAIKVLMKSFMFEKAAMQEHFNNDYVESDQYPNATYEGSILGFENIDFNKDGIHSVVTEGTLTMHGVSKSIKKDGTITIKGKDIAISTAFDVQLSDYKITVPSNYLKKISNIINIKIDATLQPYQR